MSTTIPPAALDRLERLRGLFDSARFQQLGLDAPVLQVEMRVVDAQTALTFGSRGLPPFEVDDADHAFIRKGADRVLVPELDPHVAALRRAKAELARLRGLRTAAGERAAGLRRALDLAEQALRARGWRGAPHAR